MPYVIDISRFSLSTTTREGMATDSGSLPAGAATASITWLIFDKTRLHEPDVFTRPYAKENGASKAEVRHKMTAKLVAGGWTQEQVTTFFDTHKSQTKPDPVG